ncbi:MAG: FAD-dependent oxidoreductase [Vicinamibacterales bacterium]
MPHIRYGVPPWTDAVLLKKRKEFPAFRGDITAPVVIIGGGMAGCMTAYACAAAGLKVLLLEAERMAQGGTSRATGFLSSEACESYRDLEARAGRRAARALFDLHQRAPKELAATVKRLGIKAGLQLRDAIRLVPDGASDKLIRRDQAERTAAGVPGSWMLANAVSRLAQVPSAGGMRLRDFGFVDPSRLAFGFMAAAAKRGVKFHEKSRVKKITFDRKVATVSLDGGSIISKNVIICTGEPNELFKPLRRHFRYEDRYTVMTEPLPAAVRAQLGAPASILTDTETPAHHLAFTADHRAVFAGADQKRPGDRLRDKTLVQRTGQLMYELSRLYPAISGTAAAHGWDTPLAHSVDDVMYAGAHRNFPHQLFAFGTLHDPARAYLASRILLRCVLGHSEKEDEHFSFSRNL